MVKALDIIIDRRPKGRSCKMESQNINHRKNRMCCPILIKKLRGKRKNDIARPVVPIIALNDL